MTEITYTKSKKYTEMTVMGHCNAGRINGMDLCCCAVSMLVYTAIEALSNLKLFECITKYGGGWCHIRFSGKSPDISKAETIIDTIFKGFELLKKAYPLNINIASPPPTPSASDKRCNIISEKEGEQ